MLTRFVVGRSIRAKLFALIAVQVTLLVAALTVAFPARQRSKLQAELEGKAMLLSRMLVTQVTSAVAFADVETAREAFDSARIDPDVAGLGLYDGQGAPLFVVGTAPARGVSAGESARLERDGDLLRVISPVLSVEGPKGVLIATFSEERLQAQLHELIQWAVGVGLATAVVGWIIAYAVGRSLARRIGTVTASAVLVASGDLDVPPMRDESADEIGVLTRAFNAMVDNLRRMVHQIADTSTQLEGASRVFLGMARDGQARSESAVALIGELRRDREGRALDAGAILSAFAAHADDVHGVTAAMSAGLEELEEYSRQLRQLVEQTRAAESAASGAGQRKEIVS